MLVSFADNGIVQSAHGSFAIAVSGMSLVAPPIDTSIFVVSVLLINVSKGIFDQKLALC